MQFDILIAGQSILGAIASRTVSLSVSDRAGSSSDSATVEIDNSDGAVAMPPPGRRMVVRIAGRDVFDGTVSDTRSFGSRSGRMVSVSAKGYDVTGKAKEPQNQTFEKQTIKAMLEAAGSAAGVSKVICDAALGAIVRPSEVMDGESFAAFGERMARAIGGTFRLRPDAAVMAKRNAGVSASGRPIPPVVASLGLNLHSWDIQPFTGRQRYKKVVVRYRDKAAGAWREVVKETGVEGADAAAVGRFTAPDKQAAKDKANEMVEASKAESGVGSVVIEANPDAVCEGIVTVLGAGVGVDGAYRISGVDHQISRSSGSVTTLTLAYPTGAA